MIQLVQFKNKLYLYTLDCFLKASSSSFLLYGLQPIQNSIVSNKSIFEESKKEILVWGSNIFGGEITQEIFWSGRFKEG